jgi:hypothetical protein
LHFVGGNAERSVELQAGRLHYVGGGKVRAMKIRTLTRRELEANPHSIWNAFIDLVATEENSDLTPEQRAAHLVFWYEHEVQNGGHLQYFENWGTERLDETIEALGLLGAECQQRVLREAGRLWLSRPRFKIESAEQYFEIALAGEFDRFDTGFGLCEPQLDKKLEEYLSQHQCSFVVVE